ncbi:MAG: DUF5317 domain-containing protein [Oscillospiraceae bacterium]|nr:DUF5317 domain-containing protein [Oscillospiraceae bacterium]
MLLFISIVLGLVLGFIRKGNIFALNSLRYLWIIILPLAATLLINNYPEISYLLKAAATTLSYMCVIVFSIVNRNYKVPAIFIGLGTLCNYVVIAANSFRMPISIKALSVYPTMTAEAVLLQRADYFVATDGANFFFLADIIYIPIKRLGGFLSIGDVILAIGMFLLIVQVMGRNTTVRYN